MFHRASLKLGLDKAVLAHAKNEKEGEESQQDASQHNDPNKIDMQAKEIDELLKRGAYDVFREDDAEVKAFVEADIDSILERSSRKLTYSGDAAGENGQNNNL